MENLRLYFINSLAVGFSLVNINMILSTLVLIASLGLYSDVGTCFIAAA